MTALLAQQGPVIPEFERGSDCVRENGQFCFDWFVDNFGDVFAPRLVEHIELTAIAVAIGFAISFAAALTAYAYGKLETPFAIVMAFLYTIPSLAFFQLLVPVTGLTVTSAEIALVSYTLLILFRNIITGLREVPEDALPDKWEAFVKINYAFPEGAGAINPLVQQYADENNVQNEPLE